MKSFTILALASGAAATFKGANPFTCPTNTNNQCQAQQAKGFDWGDLTIGSFQSYGNMGFKGWSCQKGAKTPKVIGGLCQSNKPSCPSFGSKDKFSLDTFFLSVEFDCDLEFHYDMPDGSLCRQRSACKKSGSKIKNTQCGGATNVTIVYPVQPNKPKASCSVTVTSVSFDCSSRTTPPASKTTSTSVVKTTSTSAVRTTSTSAASSSTVPNTQPPATTPASSGSTASTSQPPVTSGASSSTESTSVPATTAPPAVTESTTGPATTSTAPPAEGESTTESTTGPATSATTPPADVNTESTSVPATTAPGTTAPGTTAPGVPETTPGVPESTAPGTTQPPVTTITTFSQVTTTIISTTVSTIVSCAESVSECPGRSITTVSTVSVPVTTVVTTTNVVTSPINSIATTTVTSPGPIETAPCPDVVPQCLNTWIFSLGCKDNTDTACYCPDEAFVKNVFQCFYAHGPSDSVISEAVVFFQGICAPHIPSNPAIVTGQTITSYITVTAPPTVAPTNPAAITTVTVSQTTVVPATDDNGDDVPGSSTTAVINTTVVVPKLGFTTGDVAGTTEVALIPVTTPLAAVTPTGVKATTSPVGTGSVRPTSTLPVVAGAERVRAAGLAGLVAMLVAVL